MAEEELNELETTVETAEKPKKKAAAPVDHIKLITDTTRILVKSVFCGTVRYKSKNTGVTYIWDGNRKTVTLPYREVESLATTQPAFLSNQWLVIAGVAKGEDERITVEDIYNKLGVPEFLENLIDVTDKHLICGWSEAEIAANVAMLPKAARENLVVSVVNYIQDGTIDSKRKIKAFEKALGCELE